jgi:hypothetical protein
MPALNARKDGAFATFERLKASIDKRASKDHMKNFARYIGRPVFEGFYMAATDGRTALLAAGPGTGERANVFDATFKTLHKVSAISDSEFHLAVKRADLMTCDGIPGVRLIATASRLILASSDPEVGTFDETLELASSEAWHITLDPIYLEPVCGAWPLTVSYTDAEGPIVFSPSCESWKYVVMPIKDKFDLADYEPVSEPENSSQAPDDVPGPEHIATAAEAEELGTAGALRSDVCPICGDWIRISERITADGRLIGTCGDAFTRAQWDNDPAGYDPVSKSEDPATEKPAEVAPAAELPQEPPQEAPAAELHAEAVYPTYVRLVIGEAVSQDAAAAVVCRMKDNIKAIVRLSQGSAMQEFGSCMVLLTLEFQNLHDAINYSKSKPYESLCTETNHFLLGSYVHKLFEKTGE